MKNLIVTTAAVILMAMILSSCKTFMPYNDSLSKTYGWDKEKLKKIQFYLSKKIVLQRTLTGQAGEIIKGNVITIKGKKVDQIIIPAKTEGILVESFKGRMIVSFEISDKYYLNFAISHEKPSLYVLAAFKWEGSRALVHYGCEEDRCVYKATPESRFAYLLINHKELGKYKKKSRTAKGRKVQ